MNQTSSVSRPYLPTAEAAGYLNYSESHFRVLVRAGKLPRPVRINGKLLWHKPVLDQFMHDLAVSQGAIAAS